MKRPLTNLATLVVLAGGALLFLAPQAQAACNPFAYTPTYSSDTLYGKGGQGSTCSSGSSARVLLRHHHAFAPDVTVGETSASGNFTRTVAKVNPENGQYYTETRSSSGALARSSNRHIG